MVFDALFGGQEDAGKDTRPRVKDIRRQCVRIISTYLSQYKKNLQKEENKETDDESRD